MINFYLPTQIKFGNNVIDKIGQIIEHLQCQRIFVIMGQQSALKSGLKDKIEKILQSSRQHYKLYLGVEAEPFSERVDKVCEDAKIFSPDLIIGIGGGSVIDVSKFVAMLITNGGACIDYEFNSKIKNKSINLIAVPTTAGTGSEVTPYSVINNSSTRRKFTLSSPNLFPTIALIDPTLTLTLNNETTLASGLDALIHCCEAFLNNERNIIVEPYILDGMEIITSNLPLALQNPNDVLYREKMTIGALFGGISISALRTGLIHTCSVALNPYLPLSHGLLNAIITGHVLDFNISAYNGRLATMVNIMFKREIQNDVVAKETIRKYLDSLGIPLGLKHFDIQNIKIKSIIDRINQDKGLKDVNPILFGDDKLETLITNILSH